MAHDPPPLLTHTQTYHTWHTTPPSYSLYINLPYMAHDSPFLLMIHKPTIHGTRVHCSEIVWVISLNFAFQSQSQLVLVSLFFSLVHKDQARVKVTFTMYCSDGPEEDLWLGRNVGHALLKYSNLFQPLFFLLG